MHIIHKKLSATVSSIQEVGQDSKELFFTFDDPIDFSYYPGQFIMLEIPEPKEDMEWKIITPREVWDMLVEKGELSLQSLLVLFPSLEEKTLAGIVHKLSTANHISLEGDIYVANVDNAPEKKAPLFQRAYSMASCPDGGRTISTMVKATPNGFMSKYLIERLTVGEKVLISGPLGKFCFTEEITPNAILVSAGSGITPLMSMLRYIKSANSNVNATLLYSNRVPESIIYRDQLQHLSEEHPSIKVIHTITRPEEATEVWNGRTGRIDTKLFKEAITAMPEGQIFAFICGPLLFGKSMKEQLIEAGVDEKFIHMEAYG